MRLRLALFAALLLPVSLTATAGAVDLSSMFKSKPPLTETERKETLQRIRQVQEQLQLLQDKLRALEKRKAQEEAGKAGTPDAERIAGEANWQGVDQTTVSPGEFGLYTYVLFAGGDDNRAALGGLEDLILTIETLPPAQEPPAIGNRFLLPIEPPQSAVVLARQPYDFKLSRAYLEKLGLGGLAEGPVLVSSNVPLDPYATEMAPPFVAVTLGQGQDPRRTLALAKVWHGFEKSPLASTGHPVADLFWQLLDGAGPTRVTRDGGKVLIDLAAPR